MIRLAVCLFVLTWLANAQTLVVRFEKEVECPQAGGVRKAPPPTERMVCLTSATLVSVDGLPGTEVTLEVRQLSGSPWVGFGVGAEDQAQGAYPTTVTGRLPFTVRIASQEPSTTGHHLAVLTVATTDRRQDLRYLLRRYADRDPDDVFAAPDDLPLYAPAGGTARVETFVDFEQGGNGDTRLEATAVALTGGDWLGVDQLRGKDAPCAEKGIPCWFTVVAQAPPKPGEYAGVISFNASIEGRPGKANYIRVRFYVSEAESGGGDNGCRALPGGTVQPEPFLRLRRNKRGGPGSWLGTGVHDGGSRPTGLAGPGTRKEHDSSLPDSEGEL